MINSHIEIHMQLVSKIQSLREEYKKRLDEVNKLDQDITNFEKTFNGARRLLLLDIIRDLEELLK